PNGASAAYTPPPPPAPLHPLGPATSKRGGGGGAAATLRGGGGGRDPALAMCRFLRGLGSLAQGDLEAAAGRLEESLDLDPRNRHATVCLAHISCFASASPATTTSLRWKPSDERTHELLRVLSLGSSAHFDSIEQEILLRGGGGGGAAEQQQQ
ncbi:unnamed protein product, partial [Ectocarpus sp. 13 AM-2016]